jgi:hypothetical protein
MIAVQFTKSAVQSAAQVNFSNINTTSLAVIVSHTSIYIEGESLVSTIRIPPTMWTQLCPPGTLWVELEDIMKEYAIKKTDEYYRDEETAGIIRYRDQKAAGNAGRECFRQGPY